jgi:beta-glucosidase
MLSLTASGATGYQTARGLQPFSVTYSDGSDVGYRRFAKDRLSPLFAFGHGLSYTTFRYSDFRVKGGQTLTASFKVTNTGSRTGTDTPQLYLTQRAGSPEMRLLGWAQVTLAPGTGRTVSVVADPRLLAEFEPSNNDWSIAQGTYEASLGSASDALQARASASVAAQTLRP